MAVIWRDIKGFEGIYQAGTNGEIKSLDRVVNSGKGGKKTIIERILTPAPDSGGYLKVDLSKDGKVKTHLVHRLVGETHLENPENKETINHMDTDEKNNNLWNLSWATYKENNDHAIENGLGAGKRLSYDEVETVRSIYQEGGISQQKLADQFGVSQMTISRAINCTGVYAGKSKPTPPRNRFPNWEKYA